MDRHDKNPWLGLNTYSEHDRLFGRDEEIRTVSDIILNNVLTVIYGRSGIGKSSLLRAGVFPRMRYEDFLPVYIRLEHNTEEAYLNQIIRKVRDVSDTWNVRQAFGDGDSCPKNLAELLYDASYKDCQSGLDKQIMLVFDQFEEIFTLTDSRHKQDVEDFFAQLATALNGAGDFADKGKPADFRIVICLREDYLYYLEQNSASIPSLKRNRYCLQALNHRQASEVICNPRPGLVGSGTADAILGKIDKDGYDTIDPAILSLFMHELYEKGSGVITLENISRFGDNIITSFYEEGMKAVSARSASFLEDRLVTSDGYRHTLSYADALSAGMTEHEIDTLKDRRIITVEKGDKNQRLIELSHDILCPVVTKNRSERKLKEEAERLEAKNKTIRRRNRVVIAVCAVALAIVAVFAYMLVEIRNRQDSMLVAQSRFVAEKAMELYEDGETVKALALAAEVYPHDTKHPDRPVVKEVTDCLYEILVNTNIGKVFPGPSNYVNSASFSPDGTKVVTSDDNTTIIWDTKSGRKLQTLYGHSNSVNSASFSPDGTKVVTASMDDTSIIWDAMNGQTLRTLSGHTHWVNSASFSPDGSKVVTASSDDTAIIWDTETGKALQTLYGHSNSVNSASFSPDGTKVVTASNDDTAIIWDTETGKALQTLSEHSNSVNSASFSPDGSKVVTASSDSTAIIWDTESGRKLQTLYGHTDWVNSASFSPDGTKVVTASSDSTAIIWDTESGLKLQTLYGHTDWVNSASFSPDGTKVVTASDDNTAIIWDVWSRQKLQTLDDGYISIWFFNSFSSFNGIKVGIVLSGSPFAIIQDADSGHTLQTLSGHTDWVTSVSFSLDGNKVVTASMDDTAIIWDTETGKALQTLYGHSNSVNSASFSPDGSKVVTASSDSTAIIWDTESGRKLQTLYGHTGEVNSASFSPDGIKVVTASEDNTTIIWDTESG